MAKKGSNYGKQDNISQQFLSIAKRKNYNENSATSKAIARGIKSKKETREVNSEVVYMNGIPFKISAKKAAEIRAKNEMEIAGR